MKQTKLDCYRLIKDSTVAARSTGITNSRKRKEKKREWDLVVNGIKRTKGKPLLQHYIEYTSTLKKNIVYMIKYSLNHNLSI